MVEGGNAGHRVEHAASAWRCSRAPHVHGRGASCTGGRGAQLSRLSAPSAHRLAASRATGACCAAAEASSGALRKAASLTGAPAPGGVTPRKLRMSGRKVKNSARRNRLRLLPMACCSWKSAASRAVFTATSSSSNWMVSSSRREYWLDGGISTRRLPPTAIPSTASWKIGRKSELSVIVSGRPVAVCSMTSPLLRKLAL
mmetsp:Transcript_36494/g.92469  ORF Transcript_36494/g.92469 Transcript_36494/m.92469 type:complete len:200 (+) Transcript_36494:121-720(+)